ncbi:MAG: HD-GYP domain-containing protein [Janthinobacterium lividum]
MVDAKSPFTYRHSMGVMQVACAIAEELGLSASICNDIRRAALLHDVGKLAVSNAILDKCGKLSEAEWASVRQHPMISGEILRRVPTFEQVALLAEQHHERLDGSGYPHRRRSSELTLEARVIALADCYAAMAEERPYRAAMPMEQVLDILAEDVPAKLDPVCFFALKRAAQGWSGAFPGRVDIPEISDDAFSYTVEEDSSPALQETPSDATHVHPDYLMSRQF